METYSASADQVFVLRFWRETHDRDQAHASWRVKISHVNSRQRVHAHGLERAFELVRNALETSLEPAADATISEEKPWQAMQAAPPSARA